PAHRALRRPAGVLAGLVHRGGNGQAGCGGSRRVPGGGRGRAHPARRGRRGTRPAGGLPRRGRRLTMPAADGTVDRRALAAWLAARLTTRPDRAGTSVDLSSLVRAGGGQSGDTWLLRASWTRHGRTVTADLVLRGQPGYDGIFLRPDAGREFAV